MLFAAIYTATNTTEEASSGRFNCSRAGSRRSTSRRTTPSPTERGIAIFEPTTPRPCWSRRAVHAVLRLRGDAVSRSSRPCRCSRRHRRGATRSAEAASGSRSPTGAAENSTSRQSAFASRICSTVRQFASSSRGRADEVREALRPRDRDVEPVAREQEVEPARDVLAARARHRVEDDRRLLALELVDGADPDRRSGICSRRQRTCALYGATTMTSSCRSVALAVLVARTASRAAARSPPRPPSASSGDGLSVARVLDRRGSGCRSRAATDRSRRDRRRLEPALVERRPR